MFQRIHLRLDGAERSQRALKVEAMFQCPPCLPKSLTTPLARFSTYLTSVIVIEKATSTWLGDPTPIELKSLETATIWCYSLLLPVPHWKVFPQPSCLICCLTPCIPCHQLITDGWHGSRLCAFTCFKSWLTKAVQNYSSKGKKHIKMNLFMDCTALKLANHQ